MSRTDRIPATRRRSEVSLDRFAGEIMEVVPALMRRLRYEVRRHRPRSLTVPQMRALGYINRNPGTSLSALAERLGVSLPTASTLVNRMVGLGLVRRVPDPNERRRHELTVTREGRALYRWTTARVRDSLTAELRGMSRSEIGDVRRALSTLSRVLDDPSGRAG
jgi:DNA-binding MarR family transcriptional regulator